MADDRQNSEHLTGFRFPETIEPTASMNDAVCGADIVLLAAPSSGILAMAEAAAKAADETAPVVICAKGLSDRGALLSDGVRSLWQGPVLVLSGPSFADEVAQDLPTILTLAGPAAAAARVANQLSGERFVLCPTSDITGTQIAAVFKNVAATLCGVSDGIGLGANARAALMSEAMREAANLIRSLGGDVTTLLGPAGFGDFALTCTDAKSRNYSFGRLLGQGGAADGATATREGAANVEALLRLARRAGVDAPLAAAVSDLLSGRVVPREAVDAAFAWRRSRSELAACAA